jgi:hypothetical protein
MQYCKQYHHIVVGVVLSGNSLTDCRDTPRQMDINIKFLEAAH